MALVQKRDTKKTVTSLIALGVFIVGGIVAIVILLPKSSSNVNSETGTTGSGRDLPTYTQFGEDVYQSDQFKELRDYLNGTPSATNVNTNSGGNPNPFRAQ
jgi:hypothetical protein